MLRAVDVTVNGDRRQLDDPTTVADVVAGFCASTDGIAVARNGDVIPRSAWPMTTLGAGDRVEILTAAAGG